MKPVLKTQEQKKAYEEGRKMGRIEGMLTYQKHLISQLTKENEKLNEQLKKLND